MPVWRQSDENAKQPRATVFFFIEHIFIIMAMANRNIKLSSLIISREDGVFYSFMCF